MPIRLIIWGCKDKCYQYHKGVLQYRDGFYDVDAIVDRAMEYGSNMSFNTEEEADKFVEEYGKEAVRADLRA